MKISNIFEFIEARSAKIFTALNPQHQTEHEAYVFSAVRILFAALMMSRYLYAFIFSSMSYEFNHLLYWPYFIVYIALLLGLFTPLTCLILIYLETTTPLYIEVPINVLIPFILLFMNAGKRWSLDSLFFKHSFLDNWYKQVTLSRMRIYLLIPYATLSLLAIKQHATDSAWLSLSVNQSIYTNPFISHTSEALIQLVQESNIVRLLLKIGLITQIIWEVLLFPLVFFKRGQIFVFGYGFFFFIVSHFTLNLSSLGAMEILYWVIIFHPEFINLFRKNENA